MFAKSFDDEQMTIISMLKMILLLLSLLRQSGCSELPTNNLEMMNLRRDEKGANSKNYGDQQHPAKSCAEIFERAPNLPSGAYWLEFMDVGSNKTFQEQTYCENAPPKGSKERKVPNLRIKTPSLMAPMGGKPSPFSLNALGTPDKEESTSVENLTSGRPDKEPVDAENLNEQQQWPLAITPPTDKEMKQRLESVKEIKDKKLNNFNADQTLVNPSDSLQSSKTEIYGNYENDTRDNGTSDAVNATINEPVDKPFGVISEKAVHDNSSFYQSVDRNDSVGGRTANESIATQNSTTSYQSVDGNGAIGRKISTDSVNQSIYAIGLFGGRTPNGSIATLNSPSVYQNINGNDAAVAKNPTDSIATKNSASVHQSADGNLSIDKETSNNSIASQNSTEPGSGSNSTKTPAAKTARMVLLNWRQIQIPRINEPWYANKDVLHRPIAESNTEKRVKKEQERERLFIKPGLNRGMIETFIAKNSSDAKQIKINGKGEVRDLVTAANAVNRAKDIHVTPGQELSITGKIGDPVKKPNPDELHGGLWTKEAERMMKQLGLDMEKDKQHASKPFVEIIDDRNKNQNYQPTHNPNSAKSTKDKMKDFFNKFGSPISQGSMLFLNQAPPESSKSSNALSNQPKKEKGSAESPISEVKGGNFGSKNSTRPEFKVFVIATAASSTGGKDMNSYPDPNFQKKIPSYPKINHEDSALLTPDPSQSHEKLAAGPLPLDNLKPGTYKGFNSSPEPDVETKIPSYSRFNDKDSALLASDPSSRYHAIQAGKFPVNNSRPGNESLGNTGTAARSQTSASAQVQTSANTSTNISSHASTSTSTHGQSLTSSKPPSKPKNKSKAQLNMERAQKGLDVKLKNFRNNLQKDTNRNYFHWAKQPPEKTAMQLRLEEIMRNLRKNKPGQESKPDDNAGVTQNQNGGNNVGASVDIKYESNNGNNDNKISISAKTNSSTSVGLTEGVKNDSGDVETDVVDEDVYVRPLDWPSESEEHIPTTAEINKELNSIPFAQYAPKRVNTFHARPSS